MNLNISNVRSRRVRIHSVDTLNWGAASSRRWYWLSCCRCSVSLTTSLMVCRIPLQQAWARCNKGRSGAPPVEQTGLTLQVSPLLSCIFQITLHFSPSVCLMILSSSRGYLVILCISDTSKSFSCSLRQWGLASHSWTGATRACDAQRDNTSVSICVCTWMICANRGSLRFLFLMSSTAWECWLQSCDACSWNSSPAWPSNCKTHNQTL